MEHDDRPLPRAALRAADADRERVAEVLRRAHAEGRLDLAEFDDRVRGAWAARTYGELDALSADLPPVPPAPAARPPAPRPSDRERAVAVWAAVSAINVLVWLVVSVSAGAFVHPWWIWVAGPWGAVLLASWLADRRTG